MGTATAWAERSAVPVDGTLDGLGRLVDTELDRVAGMLFTATAREDLDELARTQRLKDEAFALQLRQIVRIVNTAQQAQREFAADEVALALNLSPLSGAVLTQLALDAAALPGLLEAVEAGVWTERHLRVVLDELALHPTLLAEQRQAAVLIALARYRGQTPGELRTLLRRVVLRIDPTAQRRRTEQADHDRTVRITPLGDGQAQLIATGPLARLAEIGAALDHALTQEQRPDSDDRGVDARRFDALHTLVTGGTDAGGWLAIVLTPSTPSTPSTDTADAAGTAEVPGLGPVPPWLAAELAARASLFERHDLDPHGQVIGVTDRCSSPDRLLTQPTHTDPGTDRYVATPRLKRLLEARDRTCTFPGCPRPATRTDKDHLTPWPLGPTNRQNMHCLCRHHHRAKQASFTVQRLPDGSTHWTTRSGWTFTRRPWGY